MQIDPKKDGTDAIGNINGISNEALKELEELDAEQKNILKKYRGKLEESKIDEIRKKLHES